jgi:ABC-type phosphate transport system substrate-binding protein
VAHYRFTEKEFTKYVGPANDKAFEKKNATSTFKKYAGASGVCAGVLINKWSIGYSSIGEAVLHNLPVPLFKQNARQTKAIKAGNFRMIAVA